MRKLHMFQAVLCFRQQEFLTLDECRECEYHYDKYSSEYCKWNEDVANEINGAVEDILQTHKQEGN